MNFSPSCSPYPKPPWLFWFILSQCRTKPLLFPNKWERLAQTHNKTFVTSEHVRPESRTCSAQGTLAAPSNKGPSVPAPCQGWMPIVLNLIAPWTPAPLVVGAWECHPENQDPLGWAKWGYCFKSGLLYSSLFKNIRCSLFHLSPSPQVFAPNPLPWTLLPKTAAFSTLSGYLN